MQARLILSHGAVILLALALVLLISAAFLRRYERVAEEERLRQLAVPLVAEANVLTLANRTVGRSPAFRIETLDAQAEAMDVRLLVVDPDAVVRYDTADEPDLRREEITPYASIVAAVYERARAGQSLAFEVVSPPRDQLFAGQRVLIAAGQTGVIKPRRVLVIVADPRRYPLLGLFLPRMALVAGLSLIAASAVGYALSRRIAGPVERLTAAADAMAAGTLEQAVPGAGDDDIGRLVGSFNAMSARVAATDRSQRELLANVAHELRTPLTAVQGYARALRDGVIDESSRDDALGVIGRQAERMGALIGQLLDLARLESGQSPLARDPVAVGALLDDAVAAFRPAAADAGVALSAASTPGLAVLGDAARLAQVLANLIANALRHTPSGGAVTLQAHPVDGQPGTVRIIVADTGSGIAPDRLPRIFDRFERGDQASGDGFGLGLAIVQELVSRHGGRIAVASRPGLGTTFMIDLPAV